MNEKKTIKANNAAELFEKAAAPVNQGAKVEKIYISSKRGIFKMILEKLQKK